MPPLILLVDDDRDFLDIHRRLLEASGYRVVCCRGVEEAWTFLAGERPALVISDLMMQARDDGFGLTRRLKADPRLAAVPVILLTAVSSRCGYDFSPRTPAERATMGADAFFDKPVDPACLLAAIRDLLEGEQGTGENGEKGTAT